MYDSGSLHNTIKNLVRDDKKALDEIYHFYYPRLFSFAKGFLKVEDDIDDILQDVFVKLWLNRQKIKNVETFNAWLFTIAKNSIVSYFREKTKHRDFEERLKQLTVKDEIVVDVNIDYKDLKVNVEKLIEMLPEKRKQVFKLSREEGMSNREIADKLNISVKTVEDHITHSLSYLRKHLKDIGIICLLYVDIFL